MLYVLISLNSIDFAFHLITPLVPIVYIPLPLISRLRMRGYNANRLCASCGVWNGLAETKGDTDEIRGICVCVTAPAYHTNYRNNFAMRQLRREMKNCINQFFN